MNIERIINNYFRNTPFLLLLTSEETTKLTDEQIKDGLVKLRDEAETFRMKLVTQKTRIDASFPHVKAWNLGGMVAIMLLIVQELNVEIQQAEKRMLRQKMKPVNNAANQC